MARKSSSTEEALAAMRLDPDIIAESLPPQTTDSGGAQPQQLSAARVPFSVRGGSFVSNAATAALVTEVGLPKLTEFTSRFYSKAFVDRKLDPFIRDHDDPHANRFASWIFEKMGGGNVWTEERTTRSVCPFSAHGNRFQTPHDRSSAHYAAWHSPKRDPEVWGEHFQLDDCRVWMRLHFWAAREAGIFEEHPRFADYYVRLIGHFVSVYEKKAPPFARESARWSEDPANILDYNTHGTMRNVEGISLRDALAQLPAEERGYTGSGASVLLWPYER